MTSSARQVTPPNRRVPGPTGAQVFLLPAAPGDMLMCSSKQTSQTIKRVSTNNNIKQCSCAVLKRMFPWRARYPLRQVQIRPAPNHVPRDSSFRNPGVRSIRKLRIPESRYPGDSLCTWDFTPCNQDCDRVKAAKVQISYFVDRLLHHIILHYDILCCIIFSYNILYYIVLYYIMLYHITLHHIILYYYIIFYILC